MSARSDARRWDERGVLTAMFAVLAIFFILIISVLAESGRKLNNLSRAEDLASEVARAAAATLDIEELARGNAVIDPTDRPREQADLLVAAFDDVTIENFAINGEQVFVQVRVEGTSFIPGFNIDGVGSHTALALDPFG